MERYLAKHGLPASLMRRRRVPVLSVERLFREYRVGSVNYLKIDTEGHDAVILGAYLDMVERRPDLRAGRILFESNALTARENVMRISERLRALGYSVEKRGDDTLAVYVGID